jgi:hypothetical protein
MADAHGSGPCVRKDVRVQLPPRPLESHVRGFPLPLVVVSGVFWGSDPQAPAGGALPPGPPVGGGWVGMVAVLGVMVGPWRVGDRWRRPLVIAGVAVGVLVMGAAGFGALVLRLARVGRGWGAFGFAVGDDGERGAS